jgi:hypothetical protein
VKIGDLVMLIGCEPGLPTMGSIGEIVEGFDGEDFGVDFPGIIAPGGPEPYFYVPPKWLMVIPDSEIHEVIEAVRTELRVVGSAHWVAP